MIVKTAPTYEVKIYIAGDVGRIRQICAALCLEVGLCVTVEPLDFVYTGGQESGARIGLINYPRFPSSPETLRETAIVLADRLRAELSQQSYSIISPDETIWNSTREPSPLLLGSSP
jgi:hypothetical protein